MKTFTLTTIVCVTLLVIHNGSCRPQIAKAKPAEDDQLPEDSYFPRDAAGNVVMPDPSRARFSGSEGFQVSIPEAKNFDFRADEELPSFLMAPALQASASAQDAVASEVSEPSYGDIVPGVWTNDGSQSFQNGPSVTQNQNQNTQEFEDKPSGEPIGLDMYNQDANVNTEYQNQSPSTSFGGIRGTGLGRNLRALNEILNGDSVRKARSSHSDDDSVENVGIYKSMVFIN